MHEAVTARRVLGTYVLLTVLSTLASSFIWGINTLFLLDAGLGVTAAFSVNAFYTLGEMLFEVPTGVVADTVGRRASYLLGASTLFASTLLYFLLWRIHGPFWAWALTSLLLGLGFTFFSGATEAWLVDGLNSAGYSGSLESAFAKGQVASGAAMLTGTVAGGLVAQLTNLGVPYLVRALMLALTFVIAFRWMRDVGFAPRTGASPGAEMRRILRDSLDHGLGNPPVRWLMLASPFSAGVGIYVFYALQPYLLELYGGRGSYAIAGLAAAIVAGTQMLGGAAAPRVSRAFHRRTTLLLVGTLLSAAALALIGVGTTFPVALVALAAWGTAFAAVTPVRLAFINGLIPSEQRATVLSSDNLLGSAGGVVLQPLLGRSADAWGYPVSYLASAGVALLSLPFVLLARRTRATSDPTGRDEEAA
ncbi:MAG: MFS transporter [Acidobacteria bacterium]|nr:MFS transporter [Acidobacteriota bacterium]